MGAKHVIKARVAAEERIQITGGEAFDNEEVEFCCEFEYWGHHSEDGMYFRLSMKV
jgi:hypothetical protein